MISEEEKWSDYEYCLEQVSQDGLNLRFVKNKTPEICLAAVTQNGLALRWVEDQIEEICLAAVTQDKNAILMLNMTMLRIFKEYMEYVGGTHDCNL